ncbi:hypothetical protein PC129_g17626 [Phytophthora cactorum]|uniref:Transmembrane protein n=1 Tax=Phytophthora cactorum TaxID=29920 RepID=A0A8T0YTX1_9STRA|nr:hypothetical protein Pcac1_g6988 [Phytophthora cactorum]KAG2808156.1 hypothetical protein PC111_g16615 [Phytophthora cactorum]KAG2809338.1 hypothetical protein PC112_g16553 [Phytophthora cactorum]KAG2851005.1 hypothetical protein PC113_g16284 [Phytophthora cactorum]KAG2888871.1 hypothetical protein PC114_g18216 [Phytophthora cactorum]
MAALEGNANSSVKNTVTIQRLSVDGPRFPPEIQPHAKKLSTQGFLVQDYEITYRTCVAIFVVVLAGVSMTPLKEYYLGSYVTKPFDEVRDEIAARKLNQMGVVMSGVHYFDTFSRSLFPLIDLETREELSRSTASDISLTDFLVRANLRRDDLLAGLPEHMLQQPVDLMVDVLAPLCGPVTDSVKSWETEPQLLFGNWFPAIRHEFCRDFHDKFPLDRYFNHATTAPIDANLSKVGDVTLGLIAVVNMSEVYLRHFNDAVVVRKIMKHVQEGYMDMSLPDYTNTIADAIVERYSNGISLGDVVALLPGSFDIHHVALVDVLGVSALLALYLETQQLTMGVNVNGEAAILAEVTHAAASFFTSDFLINTVGMHLTSTMHLAPFWNCAIKHTTMDKAITVNDVDAEAIKQCGNDLSRIIPTFAANLMFLFQKDDRDYTKLDNTTVYTVGRRRETTAGYVALTLPETLTESPLLAIDGTAWTKSRSNKTSSQPATTPYGYLYTPDCRGIVDSVMQQSGRNVQKYQAYMGDGLGNCAFRDSQETELQTLCRLFMTSDEVLFRDLDGNLIHLPTCASLVTTTDPEMQVIEEENLRQIEWFMIDTTLINRRIRIQDNTSRQIRTFLLILNLIGASYYALEYIYILKSVWIFIRNSVYRPVEEIQSRLPSLESIRNDAIPLVRIGLLELLQCDPADGALEHPGTMVLMYLGAIGALSNIFSLGCSAQLSTAEGSIVIYCTPAIPVRSLTLVFTTLSSSYWVIRVTLQTRSLAMRLDHAARNDFLRFWTLNAAAVLVIHFSCKVGADLMLRNAELHSDPHLYAIFGGLAVALIISTGFLLLHVASTDSKRLKNLVRLRTSRTLWREVSARESDDRAFVAKWSTKGLDSVLYHCATPQIARQLELFGSRQQGESGLARKLKKFVVDQPSGVKMHQFVAVHCAAGSHAHLKTVRWYLEQNGSGGVMSVNPTPKAAARVVCTTEDTDIS